MHVHEQFQAVGLVLVIIVRVGDDAHVIVLPCLGLNMLDDVGIMAVGNIGYDNADGASGVEAQAHGKGIGMVALFLGQLLNLLPQVGTNAVEPPQCA